MSKSTQTLCRQCDCEMHYDLTRMEGKFPEAICPDCQHPLFIKPRGYIDVFMNPGTRIHEELSNEQFAMNAIAEKIIPEFDEVMKKMLKDKNAAYNRKSKLLEKYGFIYEADRNWYVKVWDKQLKPCRVTVEAIYDMTEEQAQWIAENPAHATLVHEWTKKWDYLIMGDE